MQEKDLDIKFNEAFEIASNMSQALPQDVMLRLYAYYKQATYGNFDYTQLGTGDNLRNAFKTNAWLQISHLTEEEAKILYIETVNIIYKK